MNTVKCPVCLSTHTHTHTEVDTAQLAALYSEEVRIDVAPYFSGKIKLTMRLCSDCDLRFFEPMFPGDELFYEHLQQFDWYYRDDKTEYEFAKNYIGERAKVLDVGCGRGAFRAWLPESISYTGLEFNDRAIEKANFKRLNVIKQSVQVHADLCPSTYDVVCSFQVLEHVTEPEAFVKGCIKALKSGGVLILSVPAEDSFLQFAVNNCLNMPPHHVTRWTDLALKNLAQRENLSIINLWHEPVSDHIRDWHTFVLAQYGLSVFKPNPKRNLVRWETSDLRTKLINHLLGKKIIRSFVASVVAARHPAAKNGHTVMLIAKVP
ncbi:MAG TPA: class I SAM-dependent methyltransferase [Synechococcales cyanobacterium M55_K2018_004]|nr:class I SAM-dependent methyltransferase [Synechococcales cyanobacterium M55_K2018_004]